MYVYCIKCKYQSLLTYSIKSYYAINRPWLKGMAFAKRKDIVLFIGDSLRYAMTIEFNNHTGLSMQRKLLQTVSVKSIPLIIDTVVNSVSVVYLNIYQIFRFVGKVKSNFMKWRHQSKHSTVEVMLWTPFFKIPQEDCPGGFSALNCNSTEIKYNLCS